MTRPTPLVRYGLVPLAVAATMLLLWPLWGFLEGEPAFLSLWPVVIACAWYGGLGPGLVVFVTPSEAGEGLQALLLERGRFGGQASGYVWKLDPEGSPGDWTWTAGQIIPVFSDEATRLGTSGSD